MPTTQPDGAGSIRVIILATSADFVLPAFAELLRLGASPDYRIVAGPGEITAVVRARSHDLVLGLLPSYYLAAEAGGLVLRESGLVMRFAVFLNYGRGVLIAVALSSDLSISSECARLVMQLDERLRALAYEPAMIARGAPGLPSQSSSYLATDGPKQSAIHNFSELLTIIIGSGEVLLARLQHDESSLRHLQELLAAAKRAGILIAETRSGAGGPDETRVEIGTMLARSRGLLHKIAGAGLSLTLRMNSESMTAHVSRRWLEFIVTEVVAHARLFLPDGSKLEVTLEPIDYDVGGTPFPSMEPGRYTSMQFNYSPKGLRLQDMAGMTAPVLATKRIAAELGLSSVYDSVAAAVGALVFERAAWVLLG